MTSDTTPEPDEHGRTTVLEVFGMRLAVKNRRLAEILTMDAAEALGFHERQGASDPGPDGPPPDRDVISEAIPDVLVAVPTLRDEEESQLRSQVRQHVRAIGADLGFETADAGTWVSPTGHTVHTRIVTRDPSPAAAMDTVDKLSSLVLRQTSTPASILVVTVTPEAADTLLLAVRQASAHGSFRVVPIDDLVRLRDRCVRAGADHASVVALLTPHASSDLRRLIHLFDDLPREPGAESPIG